MEGMKMLTCIILGLILTTLVEANGHKQRFGENCSKNKKCDFTKWLKCGVDGKCICFQNNKEGKIDLYYDEVSERCVGRSGTNCSQKFYPFDDEDTHHFHLRGTTTNHWRYGNGSLRCGTNAFCDFDGHSHTCNCRMNYFETDDGRCQRLKRHGDNCTTNKECDPDGFLSCNVEAGVCTCAKSNHNFESNWNKCVVKAGMECETRLNRLDKRVLDDCHSDAFCDTLTSSPPVCRCNMGSQIHSDRTCQRGFGQECDHDRICGDSKLNCRNKYCQCKYPLHMKYDEITGQCVSIASGPCVWNDTSELEIQCTTNAFCSKRGHNAECKCKPGFLQTIEGECVKTIGSDCEIDLECDPVGPLACIDAHCRCPDLLLRHDSKSRKCKGAVGSRCKLHEDSCVANASCTKFEDVTGGDIGRCVCNRGYKESAEMSCIN